MNNELYIQQLSDKYREVRNSLLAMQHIVKDIDFPVDYTEDEQILILKEFHALEDYCDAMLRRARYQIKMMREQDAHDNDIPAEGDNTRPRIMVNVGKCSEACGGAATKHTVFDPNESQPVDLDDACFQASRCSCSVCGGTAAACEAPASIQDLVGMLVVDAFPVGHKCNACQYQQRCQAKKVELVGGCFICLGELPASVTTDDSTHVGGNGSMYATLKRN